MARTQQQFPNFFRPAVAAEADVKSSIAEGKDIDDLLKHIGKVKLLALDLDNMLVEPEDHHDELGSDQWFVKLIEYAKSIKLEEGVDAISLVIAIYHAVQHHIQLRLVQEKAKHVMQEYLNEGVKVIFLTARSPAISEPTLRQLKRNGIDLSRLYGDDTLLLDIGDRDIANAPIFRRGAIFCGAKGKDICLKAFLQGQTPNVAMADDKVKYLEAVAKMVNEYGGKMYGLRYGRLDEKVKKHDFEKAQRKLQEMSPHLSPDAQDAMVTLKLKR